MLFKLIDHTWKMFRRSEQLNRSMFAIVMIGFVTYFIIAQLNMAGRVLPGLLNNNFPQKSPAEWVYGFLPLIMLSDLLMRLGFQKLTAKKVLPYLHLPVSHSTLSIYQMIQTWLHPFNIYLLFFFWPFIQLTINPEQSNQLAGLVGIAMLSALNQGLVMALKNLRINKKQSPVYYTAALAAIILLFFIYPVNWTHFGLSLFLGMVNLQPAVFVSLAFLIVGSHIWAFLQIKRNLHYAVDQDNSSWAPAGLTRWEKLLASVPVFGPYWLLEWRLASRNRRSRINFWIMIPLSMALAIYVGIRPPDEVEPYIVFIFLIAGGYGSLHLQYAFSWESHFFDFLATRNIDLKTFIKAKFNFYFAYGFIQFLLIVPVLLWFSIDMALLYSGMFLYATGFGYFFYLRIGILNPSRIDANGRSSFNMEGITGARFLQGFFLLLSILPFLILGIILPYQNITSLLFAVAGLIFIVTQNYWISYLSRKFETRKYLNLNLYREK